MVSYYIILKLVKARAHELAPSVLLNQYSPVPRARSSTAEKDATASRRRARSANTDLCRLRNVLFRSGAEKFDSLTYDVSP